jgi:hypothetical protein
VVARLWEAGYAPAQWKGAWASSGYRGGSTPSVVRSYAVMGQIDRSGGVEILSLRVEPWPPDNDEACDD